MVWLIVALGLALCGGGAAAIWSGLSYMPVEWGWSQMIAGATALSGGAVTLAIAALLGRLGAIHKTLRLGAIEPINAFAPVRPSPVFTAPEWIAEAEALQAPAARPAMPEPLRRDDEDNGEIVETRGEPAWVENGAAEPALELPYRPMEQDGEALPEPVVRTPAERPFRPLLTGLKARFGGRRVVQEEAAASRVPAETSPSSFEDPTWALRSAESGAPGLSPIEPEEAQYRGSETVETTSLVGRYEAGAASYALYSDGTIEVETETGTQRFASMDDLKHFLER